MTTSIFVLALPQLYNYHDFFEQAIEKLPLSVSGVDVIVTSKFEDAVQLSRVLLVLYTQIRKTLLNSKFTFEFGINIYPNDLYICPVKNYEVFHVQGEQVPECLGRLSLIGLKVLLSPIHARHVELSTESKLYSAETVAVGGTFDHLHDGHKILLLVAALTARARVIVGITGPELLRNKKYSSKLESLEIRISKTRQFLKRLLRGGQRYEFYQISDVCGPTGFIPDIDALVISEETIEGAGFVNSRRAELRFAPLKVVCVEVIGGKSSPSEKWETKLSSTQLRKIEFEKTNL
ncbi:Nucleotidylyl transferase [Metschnikowia bicuspidata var. bicuspidata NRRL YB-4993]|uniref:Nucleotidylyl transferase n=1 Tax=Metschnikowia bicuspidata var. bicuspidata NRRL YB-4993 TaxID=869754 RepID=A0A1A0H8X6_9ASCO|nr:Nucleotidylyl transferase [Metschnikowia bicuspidata var. bicuspidata NRRL YB-4993]OBA20574.1 Nucleotidylyl transferase [Metschnikowia bicuspidata var. bicuspidata NRRL YB-4993]